MKLKFKQSRLPKYLQDFGGIELIEQKIHLFDKRKSKIIFSRIFKQIIIVWCGNCILYSYFDEDD